jgi:Tfp pilus assembly protein PilV
MISTLPKRHIAGASLADVLIASVILGIGAAAACSLSFSITTQEQIASHVSRGASIVENAAALYGLGLEPDSIMNLMPLDANVALTHGSEVAETVDGDLDLLRVDWTVTINTVDSPEKSWSEGDWTGGGDGFSPRQRTITVRAYRSSHQLRNDQ